ncbi:DHA2 family efflux MFS transporter permease subunit [Salmonella enterica]|nr:DHA2 family efflux MFS transporter permease subunit [Salmonella enterica]
MSISAIESLPRSAAGQHNPWLMTVIVSIATFMEVMDSTVVSVSLYHISSDMGVSYNEVLWVITCYLVANALIVPISGWLAEIIGRKRYYMISVALFTVSSLLCSLSPNLVCLLSARVLQGLAGGGLAPIEQSMIVDSFSIKKRAQAFALYGMTVLLAPAIGPLVGGIITESLSWRWIFLVNIPVGLISLVLCKVMIVEPRVLIAERIKRLKKGIYIDIVGLILIIIGLSALQLCLDRFEIYNGFSSPFIIITASLATFCLTFLPVWEWFHSNPVINMRLFLHRNFALGCLMMLFIGLLSVGTTQILPQMTQELLGYDALTAGKTLGAGGLFVMISMIITGVLTSKIHYPQWLIMLAFIGIAVAMYHFSSFSATPDFSSLVWARVLQMVWLPLILIPVSSLSYMGLPAQASSQASATSTLIRNLGGSVGIALIASVLHQRTYLHYERLGEHITIQSQPSFLTIKKIGEILYYQARMMGFLDIYTLLMGIAIIAIPFSLLFRVYKKNV